MNIDHMKRIIEGALMAAGEPVTLERLQNLFAEEEKPNIKDLRALLENLASDYADRAIEIKEVASGYRFQVKAELSPWMMKLWEERPPRYSRALLETLALIAYRQPITRAEIEDVRGVVVSTGIMKTLTEREWVKVVGHRDIPGRPALYATTKQFLDYFNLKTLEQLPTLSQLQEIDALEASLQQLQLDVAETEANVAQDVEENNLIEEVVE